MGPNFLGLTKDVIAQFQNDIGPRQGHADPAAFGLIRPIQGFTAQCPDDAIHALRVLADIELGNVGRPGENTPIIARHLQTGEPFSHPGTDHLHHPIFHHHLKGMVNPHRCPVLIIKGPMNLLPNLPVFPHLLISGLKPRLASKTGCYQSIKAILFGMGQIKDGHGNGEEMGCGVGR